MMKKKPQMKDIEQCVLGTILLYIATFLAVSRNGELSVDFQIHTSWVTMVNTGELTIREFLTNKSSYPIWHIITGILYKFAGLNENEAAATATAFFNCFSYWCVSYAWISYEKLRRGGVKSNVWLWSFLLMIMGPMYVPHYTKFYYLGQGSGNVWHNPTNMAVKRIAILSFMLIALLTEKVNNSRKSYVILSVLLMVSALEKPSFLQGMIPGLGLYIIMKFILVERGQKKFIEEYKNYLKMIAAFVPAVLILIFQFYVSFYGGEKSSGMGISYGLVLRHYSINLLYSFILAFAFPIMVFIIDFKDMVRDTFFQIACCYEFSAWMESALLYEKGVRALDGNWLWASYLSMFIVWMMSMFKFCEYMNREEEYTYTKMVGIGLGVSIFTLQVLCGFFYWYNIATGKLMY